MLFPPLCLVNSFFGLNVALLNQQKNTMDQFGLLCVVLVNEALRP